MAAQRLEPGFVDGTHRLLSPEQTRRWIEPILASCGITRVAEITNLDEDLGVPTYTAIRPRGLTLQTGSGKGSSAPAAWVSAAMEAIELDHAERPDAKHLVRASLDELRARGLDARVPRRDPADRRFFHSPVHAIDWVEGRELNTDTSVWLPASAAYFIEPTIYQTSTNGLASGNHRVEATLHALYELVERDALSRLIVDGAINLDGGCRVLDPATLGGELLARVVAKIHAANSQLVLIWVPAQAPVHVFWAILLNHQPHCAATALVTGAGAHCDLGVAATRAITEAVQSRLTIIQAAREDIIKRASFTKDQLSPSVAFDWFATLEPNETWTGLKSQLAPSALAPPDLRGRLTKLLHDLADRGHHTVLRVDLTRPALEIPVVKVIVPSLRFEREMV